MLFTSTIPTNESVSVPASFLPASARAAEIMSMVTRYPCSVFG